MDYFIFGIYPLLRNTVSGSWIDKHDLLDRIREYTFFRLVEVITYLCLNQPEFNVVWYMNLSLWTRVVTEKRNYPVGFNLVT